MAESVLSAENICKSFGQNEVLRGISFHVNQGEVLSIIGPSGSGKSTLLRCSTLLEKIDSGRIAYGDLLMAEGEKGGKAQYSAAAVLQQIRRKFGLVFQNLIYSPFFCFAEHHRGADPSSKAFKGRSGIRSSGTPSKGWAQ